MRSDFEPLASLRGQYGDDVDLSTLACAALRSVGIAARLAYAPHIRDAPGGKVWLEYVGAQHDWHIPFSKHQDLLSKQLKGRCGIIFAHPAAPIEITETDLPASQFNFKTSGTPTIASPPTYRLSTMR
jgi:hypothetical protein